MKRPEKSSLPGLVQSFNHHQIDFQIVKPFGPNILETQLPEFIFQHMLELTDQLLASQKRVSYGSQLVGQISEEPEIPLSALREFKVFDYIHQMFAEYVLGSAYCDADHNYKSSVADFQADPNYSNPVHVNLEAAWLVSQQNGEYNPIHNHSRSTLSSVMYLRVPKTLQNKSLPGKPNIDGYIEWVDRSAGTTQNSTVRVRPKAGMFYIFPASLLHLVYPFSGSEERRSVSINATHSL